MIKTSCSVIICALLLAGGVFGFVSRRPARPSAALEVLKLKNVELPLQVNPAKYVELLHEIIPREKLLRWYITHVENKVAFVDAVYEDEPDSTAGSSR